MKLIFIKNILYSMIVLSLFSCYYKIDLNDYSDEVKPPSNYFINYYYYVNHELLANLDSCYVVGNLQNETSSSYYGLNRKCFIFNDTVYIISRNIAKDCNIFDGNIYINTSTEPYQVKTILK